MYTQKHTVQDTLEGKLGAIEHDSGNVEVQWNNITGCVLDTLSDLVGKVEKRAIKTMDYIGNAHQNGLKKEMEECQH
jgi:hypothetical protein